MCVRRRSIAPIGGAAVGPGRSQANGSHRAGQRPIAGAAIAALMVALAVPVVAGASAAPAVRPARNVPVAETPDFNGDRFGDVAVSALYEDVGTDADAGSVNVLYG